MSELSGDRSRTHYGFLQLPFSKSFALTVAEGFEQRSESQTPEIHSANLMPQLELVLQAGLSARDQKLCSILHFLVALILKLFYQIYLKKAKSPIKIKSKIIQ